jgi:hypothetical protein
MVTLGNGTDKEGVIMRIMSLNVDYVKELVDKFGVIKYQT